MNAVELSTLEQQLLSHPFDAHLRRQYAEGLLVHERYDDAQRQARLLMQQAPQDAQGALLLARALLGTKQEEAALSEYERARGLKGFEPLDALEELRDTAAATPAVEQRLQLVASQPAASVHALQPRTPGKVRFSSIIGMEALKKTVRLKIIEPYLKPGLFERFRMGSGGGILLYGPPGCGKTLLARAVANECNAEFISVGVSDVLSMWLGESERNLAAQFEKARAQQPCVLFFDELDALAYARSKAGAASARTVVNEFLTQLDGFGRENQGVLILAATNMPWDVDSAMKRPGRFSRQIFVPPPDAQARRQMLELKLVGVPCETLDLDLLARRTEHFSGADIDGLIELAKEAALMDALDTAERDICMADFEAALVQLQSSTLDWLRTVRNVVKYAGDDGSYKDVESYLKRTRLL